MIPLPGPFGGPPIEYNAAPQLAAAPLDLPPAVGFRAGQTC
jgi:hypothetical protein